MNAVIQEKVLNVVMEGKLPSYTVFNSEVYSWLPKKVGRNMKPDFVIALSLSFISKDRKTNSFSSENCKYGLPNWKVRDGICFVGEGKVLGEDVFPSDDNNGQLGNYMYHLSNSRVKGDTREIYGIIFYPSGCTTFVYTHQTELKKWKQQRCFWSDKRTEKHLVEFFEESAASLPDWTKAAAILPPTLSIAGGFDSSPFLGRGGDGIVFELSYEGNKVAVKLGTVLGIEHEYSNYEYIEKRECSENVAVEALHVIPLKDSTTSIDYSALVLSAVGLPQDNSSVTIEDVKGMYEKLRSHGLLHGDPRPENLVRVEGDLLWIDLQRSLKITESVESDDDAWLKDRINKDMAIIEEAFSNTTRQRGNRLRVTTS